MGRTNLVATAPLPPSGRPLPVSQATNSGKTVAKAPKPKVSPAPENLNGRLRIWESGGFQTQTILWSFKMTQALASRFASHSPALRADHPLSDDQIARVAPSIFAEAAHDSRSERYAYIATRVILDRLRHEGVPAVHGGADPSAP